MRKYLLIIDQQKQLSFESREAAEKAERDVKNLDDSVTTRIQEVAAEESETSEAGE